MIYRLFRKEVSVRSTLDLIKPQLSESLFIEEISRMIKLLKRRDRLCLEVEQGGKTGEEGQRQGGELQGEAEDMLAVLRGFKAETYFGRKAYLYTAFMRLSEIADKGRARLRNETKQPDRNHYDDLKKTITELYNRQAAEEKYDVVELFQMVVRQQTHRLAQLLPKKKPAPLQPISNSRKLLDQLRQSDILDIRKKSASTEMFRPAESKIDEIISKKLIVPDLATSKRLDERKKVKPRVLNLFKLYDILEIRPPAADRPYTLREELQAGMTERNQLVRESIRKWERRWVAGINRREKC